MRLKPRGKFLLLWQQKVSNEHCWYFSQVLLLSLWSLKLSEVGQLRDRQGLEVQNSSQLSLYLCPWWGGWKNRRLLCGNSCVQCSNEECAGSQTRSFLCLKILKLFFRAFGLLVQGAWPSSRSLPCRGQQVKWHYLSHPFSLSDRFESKEFMFHPVANHSSMILSCCFRPLYNRVMSYYSDKSGPEYMQLDFYKLKTYKITPPSRSLLFKKQHMFFSGLKSTKCTCSTIFKPTVINCKLLQIPVNTFLFYFSSELLQFSSSQDLPSLKLPSQICPSSS